MLLGLPQFCFLGKFSQMFSKNSWRAFYYYYDSFFTGAVVYSMHCCQPRLCDLHCRYQLHNNVSKTITNIWFFITLWFSGQFRMESLDRVFEKIDLISNNFHRKTIKDNVKILVLQCAGRFLFISYFVLMWAMLLCRCLFRSQLHSLCVQS